MFNHQSQRDASLLLRSLHQSLCIDQKIEFDEAIFCTDVTYKDLTYKLGIESSLSPHAHDSSTTDLA